MARYDENYSKYLEPLDLNKILIDDSPLFIVAHDNGGKILYMNRIMQERLGYTETEVLGAPYLETFVPPEEWHLCAHLFSKPVERPGELLTDPMVNENHIMAKDGRYLMVDWHGRNIADENGNIMYSMGFGWDVTERHRTALELKKAFREIENLKNKLESENSALKQELRGTAFKKIVGESEQVKDILQRITMLAATDTTVLITGETGTGKELVAEALHNASNRSSKPLIKVNCPAIPETLFESELFGHVQGAFSGAIGNKMGRIHAAEGGTILLDEIAEIPISTQVKLLRFLESKEYERVGDTKTQKANVKIVASTNADLSRLVEEGKFRADLLFRLRVATITLPPLRERRNDIKILIDDFLQCYNALFNKNVLFPEAKAFKFLMSYEWPGNIRELRHVVEHACIYCPDKHFGFEHMPDYLVETGFATPLLQNVTTSCKVDKAVLLDVLNACKWSKKNAAKQLGIHRSTLYRLIDKYDINK